MTKPEKYNRLMAVSLFSGAGGMDVGLKHSGFEIRGCLEIEDYNCTTLRNNHPETLVVGPPNFNGDITQISPDEFMEICHIKAGDCALVAGGPPCQPFSIAANQRYRKGDKKFKRIGFADTERGDLLEHFVDYIRALKPECFLLENVPGLAQLDGGRPLAQQIKKLRSYGYSISAPTIINAYNFGVPQSRERLFLIGLKGTKVVPNIPPNGASIHRRFAGNFVAAHALANIPRNIENHVTREHKLSSIKRYRRLTFGHREPLGRVDRLDPRKPAKTVISGGTTGGGRSHLHPYLARTLTVRECARIQTFGDDYIFSGNIGRQFTQAGNAVPPLWAAEIGYFIAKKYLGGRTLPTIHPAPFLEKNLCIDIDSLCKTLYMEALRTNPNLLYLDSLNGEPRTTKR